MTDETIFAVALEKADPVERAAYLEAACAGDAVLRKRIEGLLAAHDLAVGFLERPAVARPEPAATETGTLGDRPDDNPDDALGFLAPPGRPDSLGRLGHYEVLEVLGRGGFGVVFRAFDEVLQRVVAVKVLAPSMAATSPARKRFLREARSAAQVHHENVVQIHATEESPLPYLVMEFIPGETLQDRLDRAGPLEVPEVLRVGRQVAEGLAAAHAVGLIHRDIKPSNILIDSGPQQQVKITDFGLARAADDASLTRSGTVAGTPLYMAPEQAKGETLDHRADLFSLGSVLYAMLTGRPPFRANSTLAVLKRVAEDEPRPIREVIPEVPEWLCRIVEKLHAKDPAERFQSAREVADVLADCERQLQAHQELKDFARIPDGKPKPLRRYRGLVIALWLFAILMWGAILFGETAYLYAGNKSALMFPEGDPDVAMLLVRRDGELVARVAYGNRVTLDPGKYEIEAVCIEGYVATKFHVEQARIFAVAGSFERADAKKPIIRVTLRRGETTSVAATAERLAALEQRSRDAVDTRKLDELGRAVNEFAPRPAAPPVRLRSFTPGRDPLPLPHRGPAGAVTVVGDAWRIENTLPHNVAGNFNVMVAQALDGLPKDGVLVFRAKVKVEARDKNTWGDLGFGGANEVFRSWDQWPAARSRYDRTDSDWTEKEVRYPAAEIHKKDPPTVYLYAGLHAAGVLWLKDVVLLHIPPPGPADAPAPRPKS
jgi:serine/threonine protein kinase